MTGMDLLWPALAAVLPGLWSYGRKKRMTWTALALLLLPVLVIVLGVLILGELHMTWRSVVWRSCGMCFVTGCAMLFVWCGAYLWKEVPGERWRRIAVWLSRLVIVVAIGVPCIGCTLFGSFLALWIADLDHDLERDGETVVVQYLWIDGSNYYAYHGPLLRGTELLEGSTDLIRQQEREEEDTLRENILKTLGIEGIHSILEISSDTHGGFHNDGETFVQLYFSSEDALEQIEAAADWSALPLPEELAALTRLSCHEDSGISLPEIAHGCYWFQDRQARDPQDYSETMDRYSYNFTLALYDTDEQRLYYWKLDT